MPEPYSLAGRAWIPVALSNGQRAFVRPCDISEPYEGQTILRIATGRADCDISLTEFLIGLLAVTMAPPGPIAWKKRYRTPPTRDELSAAFAPLEPALHLDGDGPRFFQDLEPLERDVWQVEELLIDTTAEHFVKPGLTKILSRAGAAIALLTMQTCAPEGGRGHLTSIRGGGPVSTLVVPGSGDGTEISLWQLLWANVPTGYEAAASEYKRVFPWLSPTRRYDEQKSTTPEDVHISQAFFGLPRRIRLIFEDNTAGEICDLTGQRDEIIVKTFAMRPGGTKYVGWGRTHPLSPYKKKKATDPEFYPTHISSSRIGYRGWIGLVVSDAAGLNVPALAVDQFRQRSANLESHEREQSRLLTSAYVMKQNKPLDFGEALMPLIVTGHPESDRCVADFARGFVQAAELIANHLTNCAKRGLYGEKTKADRDSTPLDAVRQSFWGDTEQGFYRELRAAAHQLAEAPDTLIDRADDLRREAGARWLGVLRETGLRIFDAIVTIDDAESERIKDVIEARKSLILALTGHGPIGRAVFAALGLPEANPKGRK